MYICHLQTDCFVVSQLFSVARHAGCFKLESKLARLSILPLPTPGIEHFAEGINGYHSRNAKLSKRIEHFGIR